MALAPRTIYLSTKVLFVKGNKETISFSFIATFNNGTQKILNRKQVMHLGLRKEVDGSEILLDRNTCSLYWKDWSSVPTFGKWDKDFPIPIVGIETASLLPLNSILGLN